MDKLILIRYGEIALKGHNRNFFINLLTKNIRKVLKGINNRIINDRGRLLVELPGNGGDAEQAVEHLKKVFGIVSVSVVIKVERDMETIEAAALEMASRLKRETFKVEARRADKTFPLTSPEISGRVGAYILSQCEGVRVDVHNPETLVNIEIRDKAYIYTDAVMGPGGLPAGSGGKGILLLSGGIDSPVAGWMVAKRGVELQAVHFHSFPFTSERARQKVIDIAKVLRGYTGGLKLHMVSLTDIQNSINRECPAEQGTILTRRFMMRIASRIADSEGALALVTGESLGQVASQTMESIYVTNASVELPVYRPLLGMDKVEIMERARNIETYDISILPYEDCCTLFLPKFPETRPRLDKIMLSETHLDIDSLLEEALRSKETLDI